MRRYLWLLMVFLLPGYGWSQAAEETILVSPDRPGVGTGPGVLEKGFIQWETGFEMHLNPRIDEIVMPSTLFRFGVHKRAEIRLEYTGSMVLNSTPGLSSPTLSYSPEPLKIGTKILMSEMYGGDLDKKWIPQTAVLVNLCIPISSELAQSAPIGGTIDFLAEHGINDWFSIGYDIGAQWVQWTPDPDLFASLGFNFAPTNRLSVFVESYNIFDICAVDANTGARKTIYDINMDFGLSYAVHPCVQLDAYAGFNLFHSESVLSGPGRSALVGLGVTWLIWHPGE